MVLPPALRVAQLDAEILDDELLDIVLGLLDSHLGELSDTPKWQSIYRNVKRVVPILYYSHQYLKGLSPGQQLMGVYYTNFTRTRGLLNLLVNQLLPVGTDGYAEESHNVQLQRFFKQIRSVWMGIQLLHLFYFLARGGPPNLVRRLLGMQTVYRQTPTIGEMNESALNRELLGHSIANVLILLTPLIKFFVCYVGEFVERRRQADSSTARTTADGLVLCHECKKVAVVAVVATAEEDHGSSVYCSYCYHLAKRRKSFKHVKLLHY